MKNRLALAAATLPLAVAAFVPGHAVTAEPDPGKEQSPIDIRHRDLDHALLPVLDFDYPDDSEVTMTYIREDADDPDGCEVRGEEETVRAEVPPGTASLTVGGDEYELLQVHWHTPSEHHLDGRSYPLEQHLVHRNSDGELLVVGVWVRRGAAHNTLGRLFDHLAEECEPNIAVTDISLRKLLPDRITSYRYPGSLTTAPYSEDVSWVMLTDPVSASARQVALFRDAFPDGNSRDVQPLGDRTVLTDRWLH
ncbi:carbonic anhydrase family protein [Nocardioides speluncae]|uniref:carbonic anhydrase family protein n=1 Tax=Nocardioides speluncae TaxID=2670337 RepID=UPI000D69AD04|nr:carbonic anhydrase family protein [Nocardioides speluncae]